MKVIFSTLLFFYFLAFSHELFAQFQTKYTEFGNPLTEIIDANMMRQGEWFYYDSNGELIRKEEYKDHLLMSSILIAKTEAAVQDLTQFEVVEISNQSLNSLAHGEIIYDNDGNFAYAYFYMHSPESQISLDKIRTNLEKIKPNRKSVIFKF